MGTHIAKNEDKALTDMQRIFVKKVSEGANILDAATLAGYATPEANGYDLMKQPHIQKALLAAAHRKFSGPLLGCAINALEQLVNNEKTPAATRLNAAKFIVEKAEQLQTISTINDLKNIDPNTMSIEQLELLVIRGRAVIHNHVSGDDNLEVLEG